MSLPLKLALLLLIAIVALLLLRRRTSHRPATRHPRIRSRPIGGSYSEANGIAKLLSEVQALKERAAQWADILKTLNPDDQPRVRTVLLELREPHIFAPHTALDAIESVCLTAERPNDHLSRLDLLERAKANME
jgi:hypothetical protein